MLNLIRCFAVLLLGLSSVIGFAAEEDKQIAITIDDLPFVGLHKNTKGNLQREHDRFMKILQAFEDNHVPTTGFVIAGAIADGQWDLLEQFRKAGFGIGNHTYTHPSLGRMSAEKYIDEIGHADKILTPLFTEPKYFRYPYLAEGAGKKKEEVHEFLAANHYTIAPVTIDSKDFEFNEKFLNISFRVREKYLNQFRERYLAYILNQTQRAEKRDQGKNTAQILLIHANVLNSYLLGDVIKLYKDRGYKFISLTEALKLRAAADKAGLRSVIPPIYAVNNAKTKAI